MENTVIQTERLKADLYDKILARRKISIKKYHSTPKGVEARAKASTKYYAKHREKILEAKRVKYSKAKKLRESHSTNLIV